MDYLHSVWLTWHTGEPDATHSSVSSGAHMCLHESVISIHSSNTAAIPTLIKPCRDMQTLLMSQAKRIAPFHSISNQSNGSQLPINPAQCEASAWECCSKPTPNMINPLYNTHLSLQDSSRYSHTLPWK